VQGPVSGIPDDCFRWVHSSNRTPVDEALSRGFEEVMGVIRQATAQQVVENIDMADGESPLAGNEGQAALGT